MQNLVFVLRMLENLVLSSPELVVDVKFNNDKDVKEALRFLCVGFLKLHYPYLLKGYPHENKVEICQKKGTSS